MTRAPRRDRPARVAFWAGSFERAGTQRFLVETLRRIDRGRFDPLVLSTVKTGALLADIEALGIGVHEFRTGASLLSPRTVSGLAGAAHLLRRERVDVLSCLLGITTLFGPVVGRLAGVPVVVNNQRNLGYWLRGGYRERAYAFNNRRLVDAVLVNSGAAASELERRFSTPARKIRNIGAGVDTALIGEARPADELVRELGFDGAKLVGCVGKFTEVKGHEHFVRAAAEVHRKRPDTRFVLVGDGPGRGMLEHVVDELGLRGAAAFTGARGDVPAVLKTLDVFVLPSISEGLPNVVLEAMAAGRPVVASRVGGVPEVVENGRNGVLVPPGDHMAMARAVLELLDAPETARAMGRSGESVARERYDIGVVVRRLEDVFEELLSAGGER
ncbi:MAG: glycosyltransferase [Candidatus Eisenbacteria bacterium]|nr:glycosyltransferase [Candidatus Eisenbacteria bacterium]